MQKSAKEAAINAAPAALKGLLACFPLDMKFGCLKVRGRPTCRRARRLPRTPQSSPRLAFRRVRSAPGRWTRTRRSSSTRSKRAACSSAWPRLFVPRISRHGAALPPHTPPVTSAGSDGVPVTVQRAQLVMPLDRLGKLICISYLHKCVFIVRRSRARHTATVAAARHCETAQTELRITIVARGIIGYMGLIRDGIAARRCPSARGSASEVRESLRGPTGPRG